MSAAIVEVFPIKRPLTVLADRGSNTLDSMSRLLDRLIDAFDARRLVEVEARVVFGDEDRAQEADRNALS